MAKAATVISADKARKVEALEVEAQRLTAVFVKAGHEAVAPPIIQPADKFLDVVGEQLRARTYVFTDQYGDELCLRPDLTVPTCLLHLARYPGDGNTKAKYCYNGPAFRFQTSGASAAHPREFRQTGIESFAGTDKEKSEAQTVALIIEALRAAGVEDFKLRLGDLGLFRAFLKALDMPEHWRQRLRHSFWRKEAFRAELKRLTSSPAPSFEDVPRELLAGLDLLKTSDAEARVASHLDANGIELIGVRSLSEITNSLAAHAADLRADPLSAQTAALIESYVGVTAPARAAGARLKDLMRDRGVDISAALESFHRRLQHLGESGVDVGQVEFCAEFGRNLEYYTGFVFEIIVPQLGASSPVAGGGRYDNLMRSVGAATDVPAVGAAIHTERMLAAISGGGK